MNHSHDGNFNSFRLFQDWPMWLWPDLYILSSKFYHDSIHVWGVRLYKISLDCQILASHVLRRSENEFLSSDFRYQHYITDAIVFNMCLLYQCWQKLVLIRDIYFMMVKTSFILDGLSDTTIFTLKLSLIPVTTGTLMEFPLVTGTFLQFSSR